MLFVTIYIFILCEINYTHFRKERRSESLWFNLNLLDFNLVLRDIFTVPVPVQRRHLHLMALERGNRKDLTRIVAWLRRAF